MLIRILWCCFSTLLTYQANAAVNNSSSGFIDFNLYPYLSDVDNDNSITINAGSQFKNGFSYFSLINLGNQKGTSELSEIDSFYTEQNVRWNMNEKYPLDLTLQLNFRSGVDNDRHRLGVRWRLNDTDMFKSFFNMINLSWSINFHLKQFDSQSEDIWQMEHVFRMEFPTLSKKLYLAGFIDHTFNENLPNKIPNNPMVGEVQLGYQVIGNLYTVIECRVNEYRRSDVNNLAIGLEYLIKW